MGNLVEAGKRVVSRREVSVVKLEDGLSKLMESGVATLCSIHIHPIASVRPTTSRQIGVLIVVCEALICRTGSRSKLFN
jgi:hypothetical protein